MLQKDLIIFHEVYVALVSLCISVLRDVDQTRAAVIETIDDLPIYPRLHFGLKEYNDKVLSA